MQRSDQILIDYYYRVSRECAKRKMLVDFHGDQKPATMTRTWPNLISTEGVRGMEWSKWSADSEPKHNVTLPFTRMFLGPMDYTPGAMRNATKATFAPIHGQPDGARNSLPPTGDVCGFRKSAADAVRQPVKLHARAGNHGVSRARCQPSGTKRKCSMRRIADYVVVARRNGRDWYVGAMTDWTPRTLEIDLSFLPDGNFTMEAYQDGVNADRNASDYKKTTTQVNRTTKLKLPLASGGGWAARIHR